MSYECRNCGLMFRSITGFDAHRYGPYADRQCRTVDELIAKDWHPDGRGDWRMPAKEGQSPNWYAENA